MLAASRSPAGCVASGCPTLAHSSLALGIWPGGYPTKPSPMPGPSITWTSSPPTGVFPEFHRALSCSATSLADKRISSRGCCMRGTARVANHTVLTTARAIAMNETRCDRTVVVNVWLQSIVFGGVHGTSALTQASAVVGVGGGAVESATEACATAAESIGASSCVGSAGGSN